MYTSFVLRPWFHIIWFQPPKSGIPRFVPYKSLCSFRRTPPFCFVQLFAPICLPRRRAAEAIHGRSPPPPVHTTASSTLVPEPVSLFPPRGEWMAGEQRTSQPAVRRARPGFGGPFSPPGAPCSTWGGLTGSGTLDACIACLLLICSAAMQITFSVPWKRKKI